MGIFGGSFDPVHNAHLRLAEEARQALGLAHVRWVPSGQPGHRGAAEAGAEDRLAMLRAALADNPAFVLDDGEFRIQQPTYTVNTLTRIRRELGASVPLVLLIGADQFLALETWKDWLRLFELVHVAVAERPGHGIDPARLPAALAAEFAARAVPKLQAHAGPAGAILRFPMTALDISSTAIRRQLAGGLSPRYVLPETVHEYIQSRGLYQRPAPG